MNLATHNAVWNSKKGAAFAAQTLARSGSGKDVLAPYLDNLVPKLYRGSYDPSYNVSQAMDRILDSLVGRKDIHDKYFEPIITASSHKLFALIRQDLLDNVWNRQWRTREAACRAIAEILVGKKAEQVHPHLENLWEKIFRVSDDSKDTVREAASAALKALGNVSLRICDPTKTNHESAIQAIEKILPYVSKKGIISEVEEVQEFSVGFICDLVKSASHLLKPQVASLIEILMTSLTQLETASMNYLQVHAERMGMQEQAEALRLNAGNNSPINDTIKLLLEQIDESNIKDVVGTLETLLSTSVGLQSRIGAAKFTMQLAAKHGADLLKPYTSKLLSKLKTSALKSKSPSIRSSYAQCMGFLCRNASDSSVKRLLDSLTEVYSKSESDDSASRSVVGHTLLELARAASQRLQSVYKDIVPLVFLAKHDSDKETQKIFVDTWQEIGPSISLYLPQIVELIVASLSSTSYNMKLQSAHAVETLGSVVNSNDLEPHFVTLVQSLSANLKGMYWNGKESLVSALGTFVSANKEILKSKLTLRESVQDPVVSLITGECKKKKKPYKQQAFHTLSVLLETFQDIDEDFDHLDKAWPLIQPILDEGETKEVKEGSEKNAEAVAKEKLKVSVRSSALSVLGVSWPHNFDTQQKYCSQVFTLLTKTISNIGNTWGLRVAALNALSKVLNKLNITLLTPSLVTLVSDALSPNLVDGKISVVRVAALKVVTSLIAKGDGTDILEKAKPGLRAKIEEVEKLFPGRHFEVQALLESLKKN